jgi:D-sedoheptulose 7-phosphate isomerase
MMRSAILTRNERLSMTESTALASDLVQRRLRSSIELGQLLLSAIYLEVMQQAVQEVVSSLRTGSTIYIFGNGGLAMNASHLAAELVGRVGADREPFPAVSLASDNACLTAIANDYGYNEVFARQLTALSRPDDVAIALSASGTSPNVIRGAQAARANGLKVIVITQVGATLLQELGDIAICLPTKDVTLIQEYCLHFTHSLAIAADYLPGDSYPR